METFLVSIAAFVLVLSVVVFVHELGHYQVARWCGVKVDSFSIGFGPEIWHRVAKSGVRWRVGALPLGGYVKFTGDANAASSPLSNTTRAGTNPASGLFHEKSVWVRMAVTVAGPAFNFIFAILVFALFFAIFGETYRKPLVSTVVPGSAAAEAGIAPGDVIKSIGGERTRASHDVVRVVSVAGGRTVEIVVERAGRDVALMATPKVAERATPFGDTERQGLLGVELGGGASAIERVSYNPVTAIVRGAERTGEIIRTQIDFISALLRGAMSPGHLSGPLGIGQISGKVATNAADSAGPDASAAAVAGNVAIGLVELAAVLSIAIGFANLLPLPVLDGGHLVFYSYEAVRGKPLPERVQELSFKVGMACILMLFMFVTFQDIDRLGLYRLLEAGSAAG